MSLEILLVDPDALSRETVETMMSSMNYAVTTASDLATAAVLLKRKQFRVCMIMNLWRFEDQNDIFRSLRLIQPTLPIVAAKLFRSASHNEHLNVDIKIPFTMEMLAHAIVLACDVGVHGQK